MQYHDYHLRGYTVSDGGETLTLDLVWDYPGKPKRESSIRFSGVALYNFTHTAGAIISDIEEIPLSAFVAEYGTQISNWARQHGVMGWRDTLEHYRAHLESAGFKAWTLDSAIGFAGFVVARLVVSPAPNYRLERP